jgi:hypothetical protein
MHTASRRWGKGFGILDGRSVRFDAPAPMDWSADGVAATYACGPVELTVTRHIAADWSERYDLHNISGRMVAVGSLGISTPWRDVYESCRDSLDRAVYAHVWTGGADSWAWVVPMDGSAPGLGLRLTAGELWAYSVESRDQFTGSNVRGHLYLHLTDRHRSPHAFGAQPQVTLPPDGRYRLAWSLGWHRLWPTSTARVTDGSGRSGWRPRSARRSTWGSPPESPPMRTFPCGPVSRD